MEHKSTPTPPTKKVQSKDDRLKAALKANMGRRKAQAKARAVIQEGPDKAETSKGQD